MFPANNQWDMVEKKKADNPKPLITKPVVDARWDMVFVNKLQGHSKGEKLVCPTYRLIRKRFGRRVNSADETRVSPRTSQIAGRNQNTEAQNR